MKFGDTLRQRSIPQWAYHNIDYDDLKRMVKDNTTSSHNQPKFIPGQGNEAKASKEFEDELYGQLLEQHERVGRFVQSKADELACRLVELERRVEKLKQRITESSNSRLAMRRRERLSKLEDEIIDIGQELAQLDRFVVVNRQGFRKILKKYKKWTGSAGLEGRFQRHVLDRPTSFTNKHFLLSLALYNKVLADVRTPNTSLIKHQTRYSQASELISSRAAELKDAFERGTDAEMDTAFSMLPLGSQATTACYWIHPENLFQLQVLLLRHAKSRKNQISVSTPSPTSSRPSRRGSISESGSNTIIQSGSEACFIACDDLPSVAKRQSSATIEDGRSAGGRFFHNSVASIHLSSTGDAVVVVGSSPETKPKSDDTQGLPCFLTTKVRRKALRRLFDAGSTAKDISSLQEQSDRTQNSQSSVLIDKSPLIDTCLNITSNIAVIKEWLRGHPMVQPLLELRSQRCRFTGIHNAANSGLWATLDTDVTMARSTLLSLDKYDSSESSNDPESVIQKFPYAVLSIRNEGNASTSLIEELDGSHLTERVRGFSLETHAVATLYKPRYMASPYWLPLLDRDIRKTPTSVETCRQRDPRSTPQSGSTRFTSVSTSSGQGLTNGHVSSQIQSSETSAPEVSDPANTTIERQKRKARRERPLNRAVYESSPQQRQRYWNEYDDGEDASDLETYTVYTDPNASSFPGAALLSLAANSLKSSSQKLKSQIWREKSTSEERESLLGDERPNSRSSTDSSDLESGRPGAGLLPQKHHQGPPTLHQRALAHDIVRDSWITQMSVASFLVSFVLLFLVVVLVTTGRRNAVAETDVGALVGVAVSLALGFGGLAGMALRKQRASWIWLTVAAVLFIAIVIGNSVLLVQIL
ncbi:MAG: hypothetical protein Q9195_000499 [Heterodermia aff. obscurata]